MSIYTTVDKVVISRTTTYKFLLKTQYFHIKPVKIFYKGCGRWQDNGHSALWFEVTGTTAAEVEKKAKSVMKKGAVIVGTNMTIKKIVQWWSDGGFVVDLNPKSNARCNPRSTDPLRLQDISRPRAGAQGEDQHPAVLHWR